MANSNARDHRITLRRRAGFIADKLSRGEYGTGESAEIARRELAALEHALEQITPHPVGVATKEEGSGETH